MRTSRWVVSRRLPGNRGRTQSLQARRRCRRGRACRGREALQETRNEGGSDFEIGDHLSFVARSHLPRPTSVHLSKDSVGLRFTLRPSRKSTETRPRDVTRPNSSTRSSHSTQQHPSLYLDPLSSRGPASICDSYDLLHFGKHVSARPHFIESGVS